MSISSTQSSLSRVQRDLADLQKKVATEQSNEAKLFGKLNQAQTALSKANTTSALTSKIREVERVQVEIAKCNERKADLSKKITSKNAELYRYQSQLMKEESAERKKQDDLQKKREKEYLDHQKKLTQELEKQRRAMHKPQAIYESSNPEFTQQKAVDEDPQYDVFISHASEDKDDFVRSFADELIKRGVSVWYDEMSLSWGDSLRKNIDKGLANSRFGVVVLSKSFIQKQWTEYELNGLIASEINGGKRVLPIWHEISKSEVMKYSPSLADKLALNTSMQTIDEIAEQLVSLLR